MNYLNESRKKTRKNKKNVLITTIIVAISIIVCIYILSNLNIYAVSNLSGYLVSGVDSLISTIKGLVNNGTSYFGDIHDVSEQNKLLTEENNKLKIELLEIDKLKTDNEDLRKKLNIGETYSHYEKIYADVILRSYDNWNETFTINKGLKDGVNLKQTVIAEGGLVGYISSVSETTSMVTTIFDTSTSVSVEIATINTLAMLEGDFELKNMEMVKLTNIPINCELSIGQKIYTSGIGNMYNKGIPIGEVYEVVNKKNSALRYAKIKPLVDFDSLDVVAIIK